MRLNQFLARSGGVSRRKADELIRQGRVTVNGQRAILGQQIQDFGDVVRVDEEEQVIKTDKYYYAVYKPVGYVSTTNDPEGRPTVVDLVPSETKLYPVGRLDIDSEGLIILTNDGDYAYQVTHPKFEVKKTYRVLTNKRVKPKQLDQLRRGIFLTDGLTAPAEAEIQTEAGRGSWLEITIHEGRHRQIRRMLDHIGLETKRLIRIKEGEVELGQLKPGECRQFKPKATAT